MLPPRYDLLARSLVALTAKAGQFPRDSSVEGADYKPSGMNPRLAEGIACANCVFFRSPTSCIIVRGKVDSSGICRFYVIPPEKVVPAAQTEDGRRSVRKSLVPDRKEPVQTQPTPPPTSPKKET